MEIPQEQLYRAEMTPEGIAYIPVSLDKHVKTALTAQLDRLEKLNNHTYEEWFASLHDGDGNVTNKDSSAKFDPRGNVAKEIKALRKELNG